MRETKPQVIVLSRNYSTGLGVIRALGTAGYPVDLIASTKKQGSSVIAACSRFVRRAEEVQSPDIQEDDGQALVRALLAHADDRGEKPVLLPSDDFTASVLFSYEALLKNHFHVPGVVGTDYTAEALMDKTTQETLARRAGLPAPRGWVIPLQGSVTIPEDMMYPCFVKPLRSIAGHKTEMRACADAAALHAHLCRMQQTFSDRSVLVQEYLQIDREYNLSGVCLDQEIVMPGVIEKTRIAGHETGVGMTGRLISTEVLGKWRAPIAEMLRQFHYMGMFDMDLHLCGDTLYFGEVNLRSGGTSFVYFLNGANLPDIFVRGMTGRDRDPEREQISRPGRRFVYEKVAWEDYIYGHITRQELRRCLREAEDTLIAFAPDPAPGRCFQRRIRMSALKHRVLGTFGKQQD